VKVAIYNVVEKAQFSRCTHEFNGDQVLVCDCRMKKNRFKQNCEVSDLTSLKAPEASNAIKLWFHIWKAVFLICRIMWL